MLWLIFLCVAPLVSVLLSWVCGRNRRQAIPIVLLVVFLQVVIGEFSVINLFDGVGDAVYFGAGFAIVVAVLVLLTILGPVLYYIFYFLLFRPNKWKYKLSALIVVCGIAGAAIGIPILVKTLEKHFGIGVINSENTHFYGRLLDSNGIPLVGAKIRSGNCRWLKEYESYTNGSGVFNISGSCSLLLINNISLSNGDECILFYKERTRSLSGKSNYISISVYEPRFEVNSRGVSGEDFDYGGMNWSDHSSSSPVDFVCKVD